MAMQFATVTAASLLALTFVGVGIAGAQNLRQVAGKRVAVTQPTDEGALRLRLRAHIMAAPADFSGLVRVTPRADDRLLRVVLDSENFYRSSDIQLEGERSPHSHFLAWRSLPAGEYRVVVTVFDTRGLRTQLSQQFLVIGDVPSP